MKRIHKRGFAHLIFLAVVALAIFVVMLLWNSVAVYLFSVPTINFWYAAGLLILCKLLFGGFGRMGMLAHQHHHRCGCGPHGPGHGHRGHNRPAGHGEHNFHSHPGHETADHFDGFPDEETLHRMHERFHAMSRDERREHIRRHMSAMFGKDCAAGKQPGEATPGDKAASEGSNG